VLNYCKVSAKFVMEPGEIKKMKAEILQIKNSFLEIFQKLSAKLDKISSALDEELLDFNTDEDDE